MRSCIGKCKVVMQSALPNLRQFFSLGCFGCGKGFPKLQTLVIFWNGRGHQLWFTSGSGGWGVGNGRDFPTLPPVYAHTCTTCTPTFCTTCTPTFCTTCTTPAGSHLCMPTHVATVPPVPPHMYHLKYRSCTTPIRPHLVPPPYTPCTTTQHLHICICIYASPPASATVQHTFSKPISHSEIGLHGESQKRTSGPLKYTPDPFPDKLFFFFKNKKIYKNYPPLPPSLTSTPLNENKKHIAG